MYRASQNAAVFPNYPSAFEMDFFANTDLSFYQHTLADTATFVGRGLHSGLKVVMAILPAEPNTGIVFVRRDVTNVNNVVPALWHAVTDTQLSTTVSNGQGVRVSTIEHLMAALRAVGVDNARIVLDAPEVPIMDGSSAPFIEAINQVGLSRQSEVRQVITIDRAVGLTEDRASASFIPSLVPWMDMSIEFSEEVIGKQKLSMPLTSHHFIQGVAKARTFGFEEHVVDLKRRGFALGSSLDNAVLIADHKVVNRGGLRYSDEFVRHKYLDAVGDLALAGYMIVGHFKGHRSGHKLNNLLLRKLFASRSWSLRPITEAHAAWQAFDQEQSAARTMMTAS